MVVDKLEFYKNELIDNKPVLVRQFVVYSLYQKESQYILKQFNPEYHITVSQITVGDKNVKTTK